jgi:MYXO-CTERM domain-containing protein
MKASLLLKAIRTSVLLLSLAILPLGIITTAQTPTPTPYTYGRTENVDRDRGDNWGWLGLLGLVGLLGLLGRRETHREHVRTADTAGRSSY